MSVGYKDDFVSALENIADDLEGINDVAMVAIHRALEEWSARVAIVAIMKLGRPHWLLSQSIANKVVDYIENKKVCAMVGFRFRSGQAVGVKHGTTGKYFPDPGYYGQYHEGGKRKGGTPYRHPARFLRDAKVASMGILDTLLARYFDEGMKKMLDREMSRIHGERKARRRDGIRQDPVNGFRR